MSLTLVLLQCRSGLEDLSDFAGESAFSSELRMEEFLFEGSAICRPVHADVRGGPIGNSLADLEDILSSSRFAAALFNTARLDGITLAHGMHVENAFYDSVAGKIFIHPGLTGAEAALCIVRELRAIWQISHGGHMNPLRFHPDHAILVNRAQQAMAVAMVRAAWEFQLSSERSPWERLEMSSMSDLVRVFARGLAQQIFCTASAWSQPCSSSSQPPGASGAGAAAMMRRMSSSPSAPLARTNAAARA